MYSFGLKHFPVRKQNEKEISTASSLGSCSSVCFHFLWCSTSLTPQRCYTGSNQYVNKNVNICCAASGISGCVCLHLVNLTPNTINADEYFKMWIRIWISCEYECTYSYWIMLYCLKRFSIYCSTIGIVIAVIMYLTYSSHHAAKIWLLRWSLQEPNNQFQYLACLLDVQNMLLNFLIFTSNCWRLTKRWGEMTLEPIL